MGKKDILKVECDINMLDLDVLAFIDHNITVNVIKTARLWRKGTGTSQTDQKRHQMPQPQMHHFHRAGTAPRIRPLR